jgi:hypothetical protein
MKKWKLLILHPVKDKKKMPSTWILVEVELETTWKQTRNETFKVHEMEQSY